jgi:hypothetical protein
MELTKVVVSGAPFHATVDPAICVTPFTTTGATYPEPFTVRTKVPLPGETLVGERLAINGVPFWTGLITKLDASEGPPGSGFDTVSAPTPAVATSDAIIVTASCSVVVFSTLVRIDPFQKTCDSGLVIKPVPEINKVNVWLPAVMLEGNKPVITGVGYTVADVLVLEQLPSGRAHISSASKTVHRKRISYVLL